MRVPLFVATVVMTSALVVPGYAQTAEPAPAKTPGPAAPAATELTGTVVSTSNIMFLVRGDDGQQRSFVVFTTTQMPTGRITAGERVKVRYRPIDAERSEAVSVEREREPRPTPVVASASAPPDEDSGAWVSTVATLASLAFLILAGGLTLFVAAYLYSARRHHRVH
jgi:hypothetical protein